MQAVEIPPRHFVPKDLDVSDWSQIEPLYKSLLDRTIGSAAELEHWMTDASELASVIDEYGSRRYIDKSCHTDDPKIEERYMQFVREIDPKIKPLFFELQKKFLASPWRTGLSGGYWQVLEKRWRADVELFREQNVPLETQATELVNEYDKLSGAMTAHFRGKDYTLQQMARFIEEPDRPTRQEAWKLITKRRWVDAAKMEEIFGKLLELRRAMAANAGMSDYRAYVWKGYKRFDYTPEDCLKFADAIAKACVPVVDELDRQRAADLKLEKLRPWDMAVDPKNQPPLRPFKSDQIPQFVENTKTIFNRMDPALAGDFEQLRRHGNLDLDSRIGKQPGGYQCSLEESRQPFIFMNAAGLQRDVETLLHEGGHAFHCLAARNIDLVFLRSAPMEFCEVASMSMELLGADHFDVFYNPADAARAKRNLLEGIIRFLPWMATIDSFQHWIYTHPGHSTQQRIEYWLSLLERFGSKLDWTGYEEARRVLWQRQLHLYHHPFYYIEYGIAQLGALQLWLKSRQNPHQALANYRAALSLGGTRSLPDLFSAAGIKFDFSTKTLEPLMKAISDELADAST